MLCTEHLSRLCRRVRRRAKDLGAGRVWERASLPRPRNTYVPSCRPTQENGAGVRARRAGRQFVPGSGEGQRSGESPGTLAAVVEREGCPIKRGALPGVRAHDAGASSRRQVLGPLWHLDRAPPFVARVGRRAHPSPPLRPQEALQIEGLLARQHEVDGAPDLVSQYRERLGLAVLAFQASEQ